MLSGENISKKKKHTKMNKVDSIKEILLEKALNTNFEKSDARNSVAPRTKRSRYILY